MKRGKLIVFEGISGTGKETQAKLLKNYLTAKGITSVIIFHPSPQLKPLLRNATTKEQTALLAGDRESRVTAVIDPAIREGVWVISLRNYVSAMVYQDDDGLVKKIDREPDMLLYFDLPADLSMKRIISRGETRGRYETRKLLDEKRKKYLRVLKTIPHILIDAGRSIDEIHRDVVKYIK